jgi:hypothetical protein
MDKWEEAIADLGGPAEPAYGDASSELFGARSSAMYKWLRALVQLPDKSYVMNLSLVMALTTEKIGLLELE